MHIIFGKENAQLAQHKYTILELDTFRFPNNGPEITAYCTVEKIKFDHMPLVENMTRLHQDLIKNYAQRNWATCLDLIGTLQGFWNGEVDSFYQDMHTRLNEFMQNPPPADWSPIIQK